MARRCLQKKFLSPLDRSAGNGATSQELAAHLVERARGRRPRPDVYWEMEDGRLASGDDITGVVVNLQQARTAVKM